MDDINLGRMTTAEQAEYARLGDLRTYSAREQLSIHRTTLIGTMAWAVIGGVLLVAQATRIDEQSGVAVFLGAFGFVLLGFVVIAAIGLPRGRREAQARQAAYFALTQEWFGDHTDLSGRDKELAARWDMDADRYKLFFAR